MLLAILWAALAAAQSINTCYSAPAGTIGTSVPCKGRLIVNNYQMFRGAIKAGADRYIEHDGVRYTFGDGTRNVFTRQVTYMAKLFINNSSFNADIGYWDVSRVTNMGFMFYGVAAFNQDIRSWDVSKVTNMMNMFYDALKFNHYLNSWNVAYFNEKPANFDSITPSMAGGLSSPLATL